MASKKDKPLIVQAAKAQTGHPLKNLLLIYLADYWSAQNGAYPSYNTLAKRCGGKTGRRHVIAMMNELEADGWIIKGKQFTDDGLSKTNKYSLNPVKMGVATEHHPSVERTLPQCSETTTLVSRDHPISLVKSPMKSLMKSTPIVPCAFDVFYSAYPKKKGRAEAQKAWNKLSPMPALIDRIMNDIKQRVIQGEWDTGAGKAYIPGPAPYLNQQRWEDEIIPRPEFKPEQDFSQLAREAQDLTENL